MFDRVHLGQIRRIIGGTQKDIPDWQRQNLPQQRDPAPHNAAAKDLFASDLLAVGSGQLSLPHEETEKQLLRIGERFGLRGAEIDQVNSQALADERQKINEQALKQLAGMTLTVVDGDFPREVLGRANLTFAQYQMPSRRNTPAAYDAKTNAPAGKQEGILKLGRLEIPDPASSVASVACPSHLRYPWTAGALALLSLAGGFVAVRRWRHSK